MITREDREFLEAQYPGRWSETDPPGIIIEAFPVPKGYSEAAVKLMLLIPHDYPGAGIDMFFFSPGIVRKDGLEIEALSVETHHGCEWQRWSRHYDWEPGRDSLATHVAYVSNVLEAEIKRNK